jgi:APA family basic amino acid/polyamine antiporter
MILLSLSAVLLPYRKPDVWRASASTQRFLGIPIVALSGALSALLMVGLFFIYMHYPALGIEDKGSFLRDCGIVLGAALLTYFAALVVRKSQGVDVEKLAAEIPPESPSSARAPASRRCNADTGTSTSPPRGRQRTT